MMASEILSIPEENLEEVIRVIEYGLLLAVSLSDETRTNLQNWCTQEKEYLKKLENE